MITSGSVLVRLRRRLAALVAGGVGVALVGGAVVATASAPASAAPSSASDAAPTALALPGSFGSPLGANDWSCRPSAARPTPVVLVHGTFGDARLLLDRISLRIRSAGFCVYSLDYGNRATQDITASAAQLRTFVDRVLAATGAAKVSLVGHSQGGMMPRYYLKNLGGAGKVDDLVGLAPSNHGTYSSALLAPTAAICPACLQQAADSSFLAALNAGDETPGDVSYTSIVTRYDEVVVPYTSGYLAPGPQVTNITLQDLCPADLAEHLLIPTDGPAIRITLDALTRPGPAAAGFRPSCLP